MGDEALYKQWTDEDFDQIIRDLSELPDTKDGWSQAADKGHIKVWRKKTEDSSFMMVRAWAHFEGVPATTAYNVLQDATYRKTVRFNHFCQVGYSAPHR